MKSLALGAVFASSLLIAVAYGSAFLPTGSPAWAPWVLTLGIAGTLVGMMVLGSARHGRVGRLALPFAFVFLVLVAGFGAALALPATNPFDPTLWFGLPPRAAVILYGIGFLPLLVVPLAYALTFEQQTLPPEDLERIRSHRRSAPSATALPTGSLERTVAEADPPRPREATDTAAAHRSAP